MTGPARASCSRPRVPGEDGLLDQVVVGASGQRVEVHQVLEVGQIPADPPLSHARVAMFSIPSERTIFLCYSSRKG